MRVGVDDLVERKPLQEAVRAFYRNVYENRRTAFIPGESPVPVSGRVFDAEDMIYAMEAVLDFWLTAGRFANTFETDFSNFLDVKHTILCNSGSSANLLAVSCLTSPRLKDKRLNPGDEVITIASGFPTTVNPILQNKLVPVFVDVQIPTYNIEVSYLEDALSVKTKAVLLPIPLGILSILMR